LRKSKAEYKAIKVEDLKNVSVNKIDLLGNVYHRRKNIIVKYEDKRGVNDMYIGKVKYQGPA